jgi:hypothetical protein
MPLPLRKLRRTNHEVQRAMTTVMRDSRGEPPPTWRTASQETGVASANAQMNLFAIAARAWADSLHFGIGAV